MLWYWISDTQYLILNIVCYSISTAQFCYSVLDTSYLIFEYLIPWYLQSKSLIHATYYLPNVNWCFILCILCLLSNTWYLILTEEAIWFLLHVAKACYYLQRNCWVCHKNWCNLNKTNNSCSNLRRSTLPLQALRILIGRRELELSS